MEEVLSVRELFPITEVELIYRNKVPAKERVKITHSSMAYNLFKRVWDPDKIELVEQFYLMLLNRNNNVLGITNTSTGGVSSCIVDPKILFAIALKANASGIIVAHNHPSGSLSPSNSDTALTQKITQGSKILDITMHDHIIVTPDKYFSFADEGLIP